MRGDNSIELFVLARSLPNTQTGDKRKRAEEHIDLNFGDRLCVRFGLDLNPIVRPPPAVYIPLSASRLGQI
jgi:hypothetical protein